MLNFSFFVLITFFTINANTYNEVFGLTEDEIFHMRELNAMFNVLHQNFDYRLSNSMNNMMLQLKIFQAQAFSRIGFISDEIISIKDLTSEAIANRTREIGTTDAECIFNALGSLANALNYAGANINMAVDEVLYYLNDIKEHNFFPRIGNYYVESNTVQLTVKSELSHSNPVTNFPAFISKLESDYAVTTYILGTAISDLQFETKLFIEKLNEVKQSFFPQLNGYRDYFVFTANLIKEDLPNCQADENVEFKKN